MAITEDDAIEILAICYTFIVGFGLGAAFGGWCL